MKLWLSLEGEAGLRRATPASSFKLPPDPGAPEIANAGRDCTSFEMTRELEDAHTHRIDHFLTSLHHAGERRAMVVQGVVNGTRAFSKVSPFILFIFFKKRRD